MNERQIFALNNPCHQGDEEADATRFEFREKLSSGTPFCAELRVINYFGMMTWIAVLAVLDDAGKESATEQVNENDRTEIKKILHQLLEGVGTDEIQEAEDETRFMMVRELSPAELEQMPPAPFDELLNIKHRQNYALRRPPQSIEDFMTGDYKKIVKFGGTTYSTLLTVETFGGPATWHASVSILSESMQPKKCMTVLKTEFEQSMNMMIALLDGVGTGDRWTHQSEKTATAFHLFRKLSDKEKQSLPRRSSFGVGKMASLAKKFGH